MQNINLGKYKRLFTFGCSFTSYRWPTWADILASEMPGVDYYNFGHCGAGNMLIQCKISEANVRYKFDENDLIIVMWTTMCREDHFVRGHWLHTGNIFTQGDYDDAFVHKFADTTGYLVRDMALITMATEFLKKLPSKGITLASVPYDEQQNLEDPLVHAVLDLYKDTIKATPPDLFEFEMDRIWEHGHCYYTAAHCPNKNDVFADYHPNPLRYYNYLKKLGFRLTDKSLDYASEATKQLHSTKTVTEMAEVFSYLLPSQTRPLLGIDV